VLFSLIARLSGTLMSSPSEVTEVHTTHETSTSVTTLISLLDNFGKDRRGLHKIWKAVSYKCLPSSVIFAENDEALLTFEWSKRLVLISNVQTD